MSSRSDFISKRRRQAIYRRDGKVCAWCGDRCEPDRLTLDHVIPRAHGGTHATRNLVTACLSCNSRRGSKSLLEFARVLASTNANAVAAFIVIRVLSQTDTPILTHPSKRSARRARGQLSMVLQEGQLR